MHYVRQLVREGAEVVDDEDGACRRYYQGVQGLFGFSAAQRPLQKGRGARVAESLAGLVNAHAYPGLMPSCSSVQASPSGAAFMFQRS
ncbi:hypothetical protein D3C78_1301100 [compost metagenome]